jgi:protein-disulfide isomerase
MQDQSRQSLSIPVAIIVAGALIAGGIYMSGRNSGGQQAAVATAPSAQANSIKESGPNDHVLGNRKAPIMIVEYSDIECPFCKQFHNTLHQLVDEYGKSGQLAWTFRHFPVHTNSVKEGEAAECAAELGGNDAFWKYADAIFAKTTSNNGIDLADLPVIAKSIGLDETTFNACLESGKYAEKINKDRTDVINAGAQGTPYSVIFSKGEKIPLTQGALPYTEMKAIIDAIIKNS